MMIKVVSLSSSSLRMNRGMASALFMLICFTVFCVDLSQQQEVNTTLLKSAVSSGAVCLDGSPPAYNFDKGFGSGANKWVVNLEGGGWCENLQECTLRTTTYKGSSALKSEVVTFRGILSNSNTKNPYFYNWNRVHIRYCDGGSFAGEIESPISFKLPGENNPRTIYFRGQRIWKAMIQNLLQLGMDHATEAILSGNSAGGLASMIHCNSFKNMLPTSTKVKCISDAGFFMNIKDITGQPTIHDFYSNVVALQNISSALPQGCLRDLSPTECFFPQNVAKYINVPLFILNSAYDKWQMGHSLVPSSADPHGAWKACKSNTDKCSKEQLNVLQGLRDNMLELLKPILTSNDRGAFIVSCFYHTMLVSNILYGTNASKVQGKIAYQAIGDWMEGKPVKIFDCAYPCNSNCINVNDI